MWPHWDMTATFPPSLVGWSPIPAALRTVSLLQQQAEVGGTCVSPLLGLCVADTSSVPLFFRIQREFPHHAL